jgi:membrane-associated phospholipid phosphatase
VWVLRAVLAAGAGRLWRTLAAVHVVVTVAIVLLTGNHYLIDVLAGAAVAEGAWWLAAVPLRPALALRRIAVPSDGPRR